MIDKDAPQFPAYIKECRALLDTTWRQGGIMRTLAKREGAKIWLTEI